MSDDRRATLLAELADLDATADDTREVAAEAAHEAVTGTADEAVAVAEEAAETVTEAVAEVAEEVAESTGEPVDEVYDRILARLEGEGRLVAQVAEDHVEAAVAAPDELLAPVEEAVIAPAASALPVDAIHPRAEHPYYRRRKVFGRMV